MSDAEGLPPTFGDVTLRFGETGAEGPALCFSPGLVTLVVGPNNAGKSLFLRELSGINPRRPDAAPTSDRRIIAYADWNTERRDARRREVLEEVIDDIKVWSELTTDLWTVLTDNLDPAREEMERLSREAAVALLPHLPRLPATTDLPSSANKMLMEFRLKHHRHHILSTALSLIATDKLDGKADRSNNPVYSALVAAWDGACETANRLGVDTRSLTFEDLITPGVLGTFAATTWTKETFQDPPPGHEPIKLIGTWLLHPAALTELRERLWQRYDRQSWVNQTYLGELRDAFLYLDGLARLEMTRAVTLRGYGAPALDSAPAMDLLKRPEALAKLRNFVHAAVGRHLVLDIVTDSPHVHWRLSRVVAPLDLEGRWSKEASDFYAQAKPLDESSDGVHAYVGMLAAVLARDYPCVFIDEPEAFLHPPLVRLLARQLVELAKEKRCQFYIATHSADLVQSCVAAGTELNILRLTHDDDRPTARVLDPKDLREIALDPLLRSEALLSALFHQGAVVCESASDRVLYREVNERLLLAGSGGLDDIAYLNAQNWQTVYRMMAPLRRMGVAAAAVVDADALSGGEFANILDAAQVPKLLREAWLSLRGRLNQSLRDRQGAANGSVGLKGPTIAAMNAEEREVFASLRQQMAGYGVFVVPVGELEDWLADLGIPKSGDKGRWLRTVLGRMGSDPGASGYVQAGEDDVWGFHRQINQWIRDPARKGTSALER